MTAAAKIENARRFLRDGNTGAYARLMSGYIRACNSAKVEAALRAAIKQDIAEAHFRNLNSAAPVAA